MMKRYFVNNIKKQQSSKFGLRLFSDAPKVTKTNFVQSSLADDDKEVYDIFRENERNHLLSLNKNKPNLNLNKRYVSISDRKDNSIFPKDIFESICTGKHHSYWKDRSLLKDPMTKLIYEQMIFQLKPLTIIEFGTFSGASAHWLSNICKISNLNNTKIYTFEKYPEYIDKNLRNECEYPNGLVNFKTGDLTNLNKVIPIEWLDKLPHPWLILEDAHISSKKLINHLEKSKTLKSGDYLIIEDTIPYYWTDKNDGFDKMFVLRECLNKTKNEKWMIDTYYCDYFGYNSTWNWNSFLVRV